MKRFALLTTLFSLCAFVQAEDKAPAEKPAAPAKDAYVVDVDGRVLTGKDLDEQITRALSRGGQPIPPQFIDQMKPQLQGRIIEGFINRSLLLNEAARRKFEATDADLDKVLKEITATLPEGMTFDQALAAQGVDKETMLNEIRTDLGIRKLVDEKRDAIADPDDAAIQKFYDESKERFSTPEQVSSRHILVKSTPADSAEVKAGKKKQIDELHTKLVGGADFAALAKEHSECPSGQRGGDLGTFGRGQMVPAFETAAFGQKVDEIGPVIESPFGYHIVQVTAKTEASTKELKDIRENVVAMMKDGELQTEMEGFIKELRGKAKITYGSAAPAPAAPPSLPQLPIPPAPGK